MAKRRKRGEASVGKPAPDLTFGEWLDIWYQNYSRPRLRPKTQLDYENCIYQHIIPALSKIPLTELTANNSMGR